LYVDPPLTMGPGGGWQNGGDIIQLDLYTHKTTISYFNKSRFLSPLEHTFF